MTPRTSSPRPWRWLPSLCLGLLLGASPLAAQEAGPAASEGTAASAAPPAAEESCRALDLKALLDRVDDVYRGTRSHARVSMRVVTANWQRELEIEAWSEGTKKSLMRIRAPQKEKGTATLMVDDLFKQSRMAEEFRFERTFLGEREGQAIIEVTCTPNEDAAVVWGKVVVLIDEASCLPVKQLFYDEDKKLARTMTFAEPKTFEGRTLPTVMRVVPADKPDELTEVRYHEIHFDVELPADTFSHRALTR